MEKELDRMLDRVIEFFDDPPIEVLGYVIIKRILFRDILYYEGPITRDEDGIRRKIIAIFSNEDDEELFPLTIPPKVIDNYNLKMKKYIDMKGKLIKEAIEEYRNQRN